MSEQPIRPADPLARSRFESFLNATGLLLIGALIGGTILGVVYEKDIRANYFPRSWVKTSADGSHIIVLPPQPPDVLPPQGGKVEAKTRDGEATVRDAEAKVRDGEAKVR